MHVNKWKLMLSTLPLVAAILAGKFILQFALGFQGFVDFSDVGIVLTAGVFLLGFLLAGTMADYKEAEKIPAELASTLETLEEIFVLAATNRPGLDVASLRRGLLEMTDGIKGWLLKKRTSRDVYESMTGLNGFIQQLEREGAGPYASRAVPQLLAVRRNVSRIDVIRRTGFLPPAYALLEVLVTIIIALTLIARFKSIAAACLLVPFVALINIYMLRLIRDIDNPFDYEPDGRDRGSGGCHSSRWTNTASASRRGSRAARSGHRLQDLEFALELLLDLRAHERRDDPAKERDAASDVEFPLHCAAALLWRE